MRSWLQILQDTLQTGTVASIATTAAVAACGKAEGTTFAAPINAVSHILWGDEAARHDDVCVDHTVAGAALNAVAVTAWAGIYEAFFGDRADEMDAVGAVAGGAAVAAVAYATDYYVVPKRFTPGFEKRLSNRSLLAVYTTLAASLALGSLARGAMRR